MQQLLNKMVPVVVANLLASIVSDGMSERTGVRPQRLRTLRVSGRSCSSPILPVVILSAATGQLLAAQQESEGSSQLTAIATARRDRIQEFVESHVAVVETLASALSHEDDPQRRQTLIDSYPRFHPTLDHITDRRSARHGAREHADVRGRFGAAGARRRATASTSRRPRRRNGRRSPT